MDINIYTVSQSPGSVQPPSPEEDMIRRSAARTAALEELHRQINRGPRPHAFHAWLSPEIGSPLEQMNGGGSWAFGMDETGLMSTQQGMQPRHLWGGHDDTALMSVVCRHEDGLPFIQGGHNRACVMYAIGLAKKDHFIQWLVSSPSTLTFCFGFSAH